MRSRLSNERGFGLTELIVVLALIAVLSVFAVPNLLTYWQTSTLGAGADEMASILARARAMAITENTTVCVERSSTYVQYRKPGCGGAVWAGRGTDSAGAIRLASGLTVSAATASVVFTNLGAASTAGTYTVTNPKTSQSRTVIVDASGQVRIN
jgi:prepilin-type N-terminal cleavage/methylation domain-containing protein